MSRKILVIDDDPVHLGHVERILVQLGYQALCVPSGEKGLDLLMGPSKSGIEAVILDLIMPELDGMAVLTRLQRANILIPIIVLVKPSALDLAMSAISAGAQDFAVIPVGKERLTVALTSAFKFSALQTLTVERDIEAGLLPDIGDLDLIDPELTRLVHRAGSIKPSKEPILIEGAVGSGRTMLASAIHKASINHDKGLVVLSAAALNEAATAVTLNTALSKARNGTLVIQECHELNYSSQNLLIETLQKPKRRDAARLILTTNNALFDLVKLGIFLEKLFYRITLSTLRIRPLLERKDDLLKLILSEMRRFASLGGYNDVVLTNDARNIILNASWVIKKRTRQFILRTIIERSENLVISGQDVLECEKLRPMARHQNASGLSLVNEAGHMRSLAEIERDIIEFALEKSGGRIADVAQELGIGRSTLYRKLEATGQFFNEANSDIIGDAA